MLHTLPYKDIHTLAYTDCGDPHGFPVLVQHGLIASIEESELFERLLRAGRRVISPARPGYGESSPYLLKNLAEWADLAGALVDALGLAQFDLLGMSSGAPYSYAIGSKFPEKTRRIFIFSGTPALYDAEIRSHWPYPIVENAGMAELEQLAHELFFSHLSAEDLAQEAIRDSMRNHAFGVAQDLRLRFLDWGFNLSEVQADVVMEHSQDDADVPFVTAARTRALLPRCRLIVRQTGGHFTPGALDDFIRKALLSL